MELNDDRTTSVFLISLVFLFDGDGTGGFGGGGGGAIGACIIFGVFNKVIVLLTTEYG